MTAPTGPGTGTGSDHRPGPCHTDTDETGLRFDRADLDAPATTAVAGAGWAVTGRGPITVPDLGCGHLPGECHDSAECAYWRGVLTGEYAPAGEPLPPPLPPFPLAELRERRISPAEWDRLHGRGAA